MTTVYDMDYSMAMESANRVVRQISRAEHMLDDYGIDESLGRIDFDDMLEMFEAYRYDTELEIATLCAICKSLLHELLNASDGYDKAEREAYWMARFSEIESLKEACNG